MLRKNTFIELITAAQVSTHLTLSDKDFLYFPTHNQQILSDFIIEIQHVANQSPTINSINFINVTYENITFILELLKKNPITIISFDQIPAIDNDKLADKLQFLSNTLRTLILFSLSESSFNIAYEILRKLTEKNQFLDIYYDNLSSSQISKLNAYSKTYKKILTPITKESYYAANNIVPSAPPIGIPLIASSVRDIKTQSTSSTNQSQQFIPSLTNQSSSSEEESIGKNKKVTNTNRKKRKTDDTQTEEDSTSLIRQLLSCNQQLLQSITETNLSFAALQNDIAEIKETVKHLKTHGIPAQSIGSLPPFFISPPSQTHQLRSPLLPYSVFPPASGPFYSPSTMLRTSHNNGPLIPDAQPPTTGYGYQYHNS